jgi:transglutaminase-like putative cysteine protease
MRIEIEHTLTLQVPPTNQMVLHLLLTPGAGPAQRVEEWSVEGTGVETAGRFQDAFGNGVHLVNQIRPEGPVTITGKGVVITKDTSGVLGRPGGEPVPALYRRVTALTKAQASVHGKFRAGQQTRLDTLHGLMARVGEVLGLPEETQSQTQMSAEGAQVQRQGGKHALPPAADYAHLFIGAARALDIPARFVTGYLVPGEDHDGGLHAWAEAFDERLGWIGFDPRLQICSTDRYVRLAVGLDAESALPLRAVPVGEVTQSVTVRAV